MIHLKRVLLVLLGVITLINCGNEASRSIEGKMEMTGLIPNQKVYVFKLNENSMNAIDSAIVWENGEFKIELQDSSLGIFHFGSNKVNTLPLVIKEETKKIELDIRNNQQYTLDYSVKGSPETEQMALFYKKVYEMMLFNQDISTKMKQIAPDNVAGQQVLQQESMMASQEFLAFRNQYIEDNKGKKSLIVVLEQIRPDSEFDLFKEVAQDLTKTLPNTPYAKNLNTYLEQLEKEQAMQKMREQMLPVGAEAPELDFPNAVGKNIKLSSLRGKVVLLDFWASWCAPCRRENPNVVKLYHAYKSKGFDVYSFSLDEKKEKWMQAIEKDGLIWKNHVSDLKGWNSQSVSIYGFNSIPFTILIDREGKVIAKNLRGEALETALKNAL